MKSAYKKVRVNCNEKCFFYHTRKSVSLRLFGAHVTILPLMNAENTGTCGFQKGGTANPMISSDQIAKNYDIAGVRKANLPGLHMLLLGFFAGMFIALAGAAASVASADITNPSAARIVSALVFPAGLAMVICNGSELFTGNCLMVISLLDHKITFKALMKNYLFVYLGNLIGSLFVSVLFVYGHIPGLYDGLLAQNMVNTAVTKVSLSFSEVFFRGILCNVMVCVAVWMGMSATHVSGKILAVYPPISAFVLCGFEHCVANMFYIPAGMMTASAYGIAAEGLNIGTFILNNLIPATIGNIFGGVIVVGFLYWYLFLREKN